MLHLLAAAGEKLKIRKQLVEQVVKRQPELAAEPDAQNRLPWKKADTIEMTELLRNAAEDYKNKRERGAGLVVGKGSKLLNTAIDPDKLYEVEQRGTNMDQHREYVDHLIGSVDTIQLLTW